MKIFGYYLVVTCNVIIIKRSKIYIWITVSRHPSKTPALTDTQLSMAIVCSSMSHAVCEHQLSFLFSLSYYYSVQETMIKPSRFFVTRWQTDPHASMSYSYIPVGCTADAYDNMADPVNDRLFFAGEVNYAVFVIGIY